MPYYRRVQRLSMTRDLAHRARPALISSWCVPAAILAIVGCADASRPNGPGTGQTTQITMEFCATNPVVWAAHLNEGGTWTRVDVVNSSATFEATERVAAAYVTTAGPFVFTDVVYATAEVLDRWVCGVVPFGTRQVSGATQGLASDQTGSISLSFLAVYVVQNAPTFNFTTLPDGTFDLVASRRLLSPPNGPPDRVIIRRAPSLANGTTLPTLDFDGTEAFAPAANQLTVTGVGSDFATVTGGFNTGNGTVHLMFANIGSGSTATLYSVPTDRLIAGDFHRIEVAAHTNTFGETRYVDVFYRNPGDRALTLGPNLPAPTFTASDVTLPFQSEYGGVASIYMSQSQSTSARSLRLTMTREYLTSTPTAWTMPIPSLASVSGFQQSNWALQSGPFNWELTARSEWLTTAFGVPPTDGQVVRHARLLSP